MDDYIVIEQQIAAKHNAVGKGGKKSIGDFLLKDNIKHPVNVKSNNVAKNNYSPNIISAKRLILWLADPTNEMYFIFVDYKSTDKGIEIIKDTGLVPIEHISWNCLSIEAQGWGVIQMPKPLVIDKTQDRKGFLKGLRNAYEQYMAKEAKKMAKLKEMIKDF